MENKMPVHLDATNFDEAVSAAPLALIDFWASWCGPCRMVAPVIEQIAREYEGRVLVGKVDVDEASSLASRFGIMSVPTIILFQNGKEVERKVGVMPAQAYEDLLDAKL
jgi:thioredoxin 1